MNLRAKTNEEKAEVLQKIFNVWQEDFPDMRLGQMIYNAISLRRKETLFMIEDQNLVKCVEDMIINISKKETIL